MSEEELQGVADILGRHYPQVDPLLVLTPLKNESAEDVVRAIDRHVLDATEKNGNTVGHWPPKTSDLLLRIRADIHVEHPLSTIKPRGKKYTIDIGPVLGEQFGIAREVDVYPVDCEDCGDSGMARFYYQPADERIVYTGHEAMGLVEKELLPLRIGHAICDCPRGINDQKRSITTVNRNNNDRAMYVFPRFETIRSISASRQRWSPISQEE